MGIEGVSRAVAGLFPKGPARLAMLAMLAAGQVMVYSQSQRQALFNGKDLTGWETQGPATWTVANGEIRGLKTAAQTDWAHLVSKASFTDCYVRVKYRIVSGNSGAYLRSSIGSEFGVTGVQVEMGGNDGSMMTVIPGEWKWLPGNPVANPQTPLGTWNELAVEIKGRTVTSFVNGKQFMQVRDIDSAKLGKQGRIALQLHQSTAQNEAFFKDIVVFTPTLIRGCMDSRYVEYNAASNEADSAACKVLKPVGLRGAFSREMFLPSLRSWSGVLRFVEGRDDVRVFDIQGRAIYEARGRMAGAAGGPAIGRPGIYFLAVGGGIFSITILGP